MTTREEQQATWAGIYAGLTPDQKRVADDISTRAQDNASQQLQWAEELVSLVDMLAAIDPNAAPWPVVRMFWVRLHGVVTEFIDAHATSAELGKTMSEQRLERNLAKFSVLIHGASKAVLGSLEESEVVVADYLRQRAVHLRQNGYSVQPTKRGVLDTRVVRQLDRTFSIVEVDRMRDQLLRQHGGEAGLAHALAQKVQPAAGKLLQALRALHELPSM